MLILLLPLPEKQPNRGFCFKLDFEVSLVFPFSPQSILVSSHLTGSIHSPESKNGRTHILVAQVNTTSAL